MPTPKGGTSARRSPLRLVKPETGAGAQLPHPPDHLSADEAEVWEEFARNARIRDTATADDAAAFEILATKFAHRRRLMAQIATDHDGKLTYETVTESGSTMKRPVPELAAIDALDRQLAQLLGRFGLTPADRSRVLAAEEDKGDPFAEFAQAPEAEKAKPAKRARKKPKGA